MEQQIIDYALSLPLTYEDYPFDSQCVAVHHTQNKKIFLLFVKQQDQSLLNLKCDPFQADFWRSAYSWIIPAYHMNKTHWNSIILNENPVWEIVMGMIDDSYSLTKPKRKKK